MLRNWKLWSTNETNTTPEDIIKSKYDQQNQQHVAFIKERIKTFQDAYHKVQQTDQMAMAGLSVDLLLWCVGAVGTTVSLLLAAGIVFGIKQATERTEHAQKQQKALLDLLETYQWCAKDHGLAITKDPHFLSLLMQLTPFIHRNELILWDLTTIDGSQLSQEFMAIMSRSPQPVNFVGVHRNGQPKADPTLLDTANAILNGDGILVQNQIMKKATNYLESNKYFGLFSQSMAEAKFALYGKEPTAEVNTPSIRSLR